MKSDEIGRLLVSQFPDAVVQSKFDGVQPWIQVSVASLISVCTFLKTSSETDFDFLRSLAGIDYGQEMELVYILFSYTHRHEISLKARVPKENPILPTVENVWPAANWYEREAYDLLGITFEGHSDLRRILLPDDWIGHPLRKDYKEQEEYRGISTRREYLTGIVELPTFPATLKS